MTRVVLDTNIWIQFLISRDYLKIDKILLAGDITLLFSDELLSEFLDVAIRPKFKKYFNKTDIEVLLESIYEYAVFIEVSTEITVCRDSKNNFLLSLSIDGRADFLITGDQDLLSLKEIEKTKITTISDFINRN